MANFGESFYNESFYGGLPYQSSILTYRVSARIIKPYREPPAIMDTLAYGLAQRFDYLQKGIQVFSLKGKIQYAHGQNLDDHWGEIYNLPRLTGESDDNYRSRLQIFAKVLTGSGTIPNTQEVLDFLIDHPNGSHIDSVWPARALISFNNISAMRDAKNHMSLLDSVLPGMFPAGVTYEITLPYIDYAIRAAIDGPDSIAYNILAAIQIDQSVIISTDAIIGCINQLEYDVSATLAADRYIYEKIKAHIQGTSLIEVAQRAAIQTESVLEPKIRAAIMGEPGLEPKIRAAIQIDNKLICFQRAAIERTFMVPYVVSALCGYLGKAEPHVTATISATRKLTISTRARIRRPPIT